MIKYAKVIDNETKEVSIGLGTDSQYYVSQGYIEQEVEQSYTGKWYLKGYVPSKPNPVKIKEYEKQIEVLNNKMIRDIIILNDDNASSESKTEAKTYFDQKQVQRQELIDKINELKN